LVGFTTSRVLERGRAEAKFSSAGIVKDKVTVPVLWAMIWLVPEISRMDGSELDK